MFCSFVQLCSQICDSEESMMEAAHTELQKWLKHPSSARQKTKQATRSKLVREFTYNRENDLQDYTRLIRTDAFQEVLATFLENLKSGKRKRV